MEIARCRKGQYFGELALVTNKPRAASAYAVGDVKCLGEKLVQPAALGQGRPPAPASGRAAQRAPE